ncbi:2-keto-3-deoxygluconate permease [Sodalis sp. dw_96]|uniref:2-keto-3-deoxygluconate permease n=1 Tax=Sodalis sp. dw_96 TaxID=2719794 RepID=UPI001BD58554|nr:2-keto-3-deoxygluconate permease [Sodalis sp. dw_96]
MKILKAVEKVPGGLMVVPMLLGMLTNTLYPEILNIGQFTTALFKNGAFPILSLFIFFAGSQIKLNEARLPLAKGVVLSCIKLVFGGALGLIVAFLYGHIGILGLTPLAIVAAMSNANAGVYAALSDAYGDDSDRGAVSVVSLNEGPFFALIIFGVTGISVIPISTFIGVLIPLLLGFILSNLDPDLRAFFRPGQKLVIPFFAFPLGAALKFQTIFSAGLSGILLGVLTMLITGIAGYFIMNWIFGRKGKRTLSGAFIGTTAGNAVATPAALALIDPAWQPYEKIATAQVAASVVITALCMPMLVAYLEKLNKRKQAKQEEQDINI